MNQPIKKIIISTLIYSFCLAAKSDPIFLEIPKYKYDVLKCAKDERDMGKIISDSQFVDWTDIESVKKYWSDKYIVRQLDLNNDGVCELFLSSSPIEEFDKYLDSEYVAILYRPNATSSYHIISQYVTRNLLLLSSNNDFSSLLAIYPSDGSLKRLNLFKLYVFNENSGRQPYGTYVESRYYDSRASLKDANNLFKNKKYDSALQSYMKAFDEGDILSLNDAALTEIKLSAWSESIKLSQNFIKVIASNNLNWIDKNTLQNQKINALYNLGLAYENKKDYCSSIKSYTEYQKLNDNNLIKTAINRVKLKIIDRKNSPCINNELIATSLIKSNDTDLNNIDSSNSWETLLLTSKPTQLSFDSVPIDMALDWIGAHAYENDGITIIHTPIHKNVALHFDWIPWAKVIESIVKENNLHMNYDPATKKIYIAISGDNIQP